MKFTLTVTCRNEMKSLPAWMGGIAGQTRQPDEIVIVDSESTDGTTEALREWGQRDRRVKVIVRECKPAMGHNIAVQEASNEHIVSTDFGVRFDPHWFEEIVRPYEEDPTVEIVAGSYEIDFATLHGPTARAEWYLENGGVPKLLPGFVPGNRSTAYTKSVWRKLGGLPQDLTFYADDSVFGMQMVQAGFKMAYAPKAVVYWSRPAKLKAFWKEQYNYCRGDGEAAIKTPVAFRWYKKGLIPAWMVPLLTAIRTMTGHPGHKVKAAWRALRKGDVLACLFMPVLTFGNGYCGGKGYLVGYSHGEAHCQQCRSRLAESSDSPSSVAAPRPVPER